MSRRYVELTAPACRLPAVGRRQAGLILGNVPKYCDFVKAIYIGCQQVSFQ